MRIGENISLYTGRNEINSQETGGQTQRKSLYAGRLGLERTDDMIAQRKAKAQQKAMKIVGDVWAGDKAIDQDQRVRRESIKKMAMENKAARDTLSYLQEQQDSLRKKHNMSEESKEEQDLQILLRVERGEVSSQLLKKAAQIREGGLSEYQEQQLALEQEKEYYLDIIDNNNRKILQENAVIRQVALERLKKDPMVEAQKQAEEIMENAGQEILDMIFEDARDRVDEENEERQEQAQKLEQEKQEQEKTLRKEKEQEELAENMPLEEILILDSKQDDIQREIRSMLDKMKLAVEDIKGAMVDQNI